MFRKYILLPLLLMCIFCSFSFSQTVILGKITRPNGDGVIGASIILKMNEVIVKGLATDFLGEYIFTNINPGTYDMQVAYIDLVTQQVTNVVVMESKRTKLNITLEAKSPDRPEICISSYEAALINFDQSAIVKLGSPAGKHRGPVRARELSVLSIPMVIDSNFINSIHSSPGSRKIYSSDSIRITQDSIKH